MTKRFLVVLAMLVALVGAVIPATAANATTTGTVSVQLLKSSGDGWGKAGFVATASGVNVNVYREAITKSNGQATFHLPPGKYVFHVATYRADGGVKNGYIYAVPTSTTIAISRGQSKVIGLKLLVGGRISGVVKTPSGAPLKHATVAVTKPSGQIFGYSTTDAHGHYTISGLATGKYVVIFNYRSWADPKIATVARYGWTYYKGATIGSSRFVQVYAQNRYAGAVTTRNINGKVTTGVRVTMTLATKNTTKQGQLQLQQFTAKKVYVDATSVYGPLNAAKNAATFVMHSGSGYRAAVVYGNTKYYYTGEGATLTKNLAKAKAVTISGTSLSLHFGPRPKA